MREILEDSCQRLDSQWRRFISHERLEPGLVLRTRNVLYIQQGAREDTLCSRCGRVIQNALQRGGLGNGWNMAEVQQNRRHTTYSAVSRDQRRLAEQGHEQSDRAGGNE